MSERKTPFVELHLELPSHWKIRGLCKRLGCTELIALGILNKLWIEAATRKIYDADLPKSWNNEVLELLIGFEHPDLLESLIACRWLDRDENSGRLRVHNARKYMSYLIKNAENADRQRRYRERKALRNVTQRDATVTQRDVTLRDVTPIPEPIPEPEPNTTSTFAKCSNRGENRSGQERELKLAIESAANQLIEISDSTPKCPTPQSIIANGESEVPPLLLPQGTRTADKVDSESRGENQAIAIPMTKTRARETEDIGKVYVHYRSYHPRCAPKLKTTSLEYRRIRDRLAEGYTVEDLCEAIDGIHSIPHNMGVNDTGRKYLGLDLIFRSTSHVQRYIEANTTESKRLAAMGENERETAFQSSQFNQELRGITGNDPF